MNILTYNNKNLKAVVVTVDIEIMYDTMSIKVDKIIPFTSVEGANDYMEYNLKLLGINALILNIN